MAGKKNQKNAQKCFAELDFRSSGLHQLQIKSGDDKSSVHTLRAAGIASIISILSLMQKTKNPRNLSNANHKRNSQNTKNVFWKEKGKRK
jgi:hypothetical protein